MTLSAVTVSGTRLRLRKRPSASLITMRVSHARFAAKGWHCLTGSQVCFLDCLLGLLVISRDASGGAIKRAIAPAHDYLKSSLVSTCDALREFELGWFR
jgi:hypothetical protein